MSDMEVFLIIFNGCKPLTSITRRVGVGQFHLRCCGGPKCVSAYLLTINLLGLDPLKVVLSFHFYIVYLFAFFLYPRINKDEMRK